MTATTAPLHDASALRERYETLRDELQVKLHLLGMDAKDAFGQIEKDAARLGRELDDAAHKTLGLLVERLETLLKT